MGSSVDVPPVPPGLPRLASGYSSGMITALDALPKIAAPAVRALNTAGYTSLLGLAGASRSELARLHGVGPKALRILEQALEEHGLALK